MCISNQHFCLLYNNRGLTSAICCSFTVLGFFQMVHIISMRCGIDYISYNHQICYLACGLYKPL